MTDPGTARQLISDVHSLLATVRLASSNPDPGAWFLIGVHYTETLRALGDLEEEMGAEPAVTTEVKPKANKP